nr:hypothetical protein [Megavirus caiporensis]
MLDETSDLCNCIVTDCSTELPIVSRDPLRHCKINTSIEKCIDVKIPDVFTNSNLNTDITCVTDISEDISSDCFYEPNHDVYYYHSKKYPECVDKCGCDNKCIQNKLNKLYFKLQKSKSSQSCLEKKIIKLEKKLNTCQCENTKIKCELKNRDKKICELCETNKKLTYQINFIHSENTDLSHKLRKTLSSLKCLSNKYKSLKKKCKNKCRDQHNRCNSCNQYEPDNCDGNNDDCDC